MIGVSKKAVVEGIHALGTNWLCFAMSGTVPTSESEMPFNAKDDAELFANCKAAFELSSELRGDHIKFRSNGMITPHKGISDVEEEDLGYLITPNSIDTSVNFGLFDRAMLTLGQLGMNQSVANDDHITLNFDECELQSVVIESNAATVGELEYFDGADWQQLSTLQGSLTAEYDGQGVLTSSIRVRATSAVTWRIDQISVYAASASASPSTKEPLTWAVLLPASAASVGQVAVTDYPFLFLRVGEPNSAEPMMLNTTTPDYGQEVKMLYFTLGATLVEF